MSDQKIYYAGVKEQLFTFTGVLVTVVHVLIAVGFMVSVMFVNTQVLGNDPYAGYIAELDQKIRKK